MSTDLAFRNIAVLAHPSVEHSEAEGHKIATFLEERGHQASVGFLYDEDIRAAVARKEYDLVITLGGDGTVLRAGHLCAPYQIPILPVNLGSFGFLIEVGASQWPAYLEDLLAGNGWVEERMMLRAEQWRGGESQGCWEVVNEAVIGRGRIIRPVHLAVSLDGKSMTTYVTDALIAATPTGSTAYALAAGGPILPPELRNILLLPVAPHLSVDRAIVLAEGSAVSVTVMTDHEAVLSIDGQPSITLQQLDRVEVHVSDYTMRLVRFQEKDYFYRNLTSLMDQNPTVAEGTA